MAAIPVPNNHLFPPGPCEIAVGTGLRSTPFPSGALPGLDSMTYEFLGTTREGGRAQEVIYTEGIFTDYAGSAGMPADMKMSGKGIVVVCQVHNFNPFVMKRLKSRYWGFFNGGDSDGIIDVNDMGALLIQENRYIPICIRSLNAYGVDAKYPNNQSGLWVPFCFPHGDLSWDYSTREQIHVLTFLGMTYMNVEIDETFAEIPYNSGFLYSTKVDDIRNVWEHVINPEE